jgi:hypothetical protein
MEVIENATIVGRTQGDNDLVIVKNEMTGKIVTLRNPNGLELKTGYEGTVEFDALSAQLISFEAAKVEEFV